MNILQKFLIGCIIVYQKTLSPDHSWVRRFFPQGYCKFHPTCSQYAIESIKKNGAFIGSLKTIWRILRCNPWSKGGEDVA
ncbi:membrane protein insertion efficiency factor YidD [Candidatus Nomurabacteria bacterium]|nr:membrane protein insertion efficiency factor YidD [Candidatus Nomurabacteria bacterium]